MITKKLQLYIIIIFFLGCASQGPVTGGDPDKNGPILMSIHPKNKSIQIKPDEKIILTFNEPLNPVSIPSSIILSAEYNLKIRGRKIIIEPNKTWPHKHIINIKLSRNITDYQNNKMDDPIEIVYSTGTKLPRGYITGKIIGTSTEIIEVGLYSWPIHDSSLFIQKVETNKKGEFKLDFIDFGTYTLAAIEGKLKKINNQIYENNYSMLNENYIHLSEENSTAHVKMLLKNNLDKIKIIGAEMKSQYQSNLIMSDLSEEIFIIDSLYSPGDSIKINLIKNNRLEQYSLPEYTFILPEIIDTIRPKIKYSKLDSNSLEIIFTEPIILQSNSILTKIDSIDIPIKFEKKQASKIVINNLINNIEKIKLLGQHVQDWSGNTMKDSIKIISIDRSKIEADKTDGGNIFGTINYDGEEFIAILANNIETDSTYYTIMQNRDFKLYNLPEGLYKIWAFESLHKTDPFTYFSGTWMPYQRAANFAFYSDSIDVRARWDVEGVNIKF